MNEEEIIASGILELYVCGSLSENEIHEVEAALHKFPNLKKEIEIIEASLITLAENVSPPLASVIWTFILNAIRPATNVDTPTIGTEEKSFNWASVSGWAAAILLLGGLVWAMNQKSTLEQKVDFTTTENAELEDQLQTTEKELLETENVVAVLRSDSFNTFILPGNEAVAPEASAKVFYNAEEGIAYIDAQGLPAPPKGKVYQVWSLIMEPLTPTSMGLLQELSAVQSNLYKFEKFPVAEGFGITLEPEGGSETPTLSQLYVLGTVTLP
ncbi:anti-sigma factor [Rasiella sp. SM2506]|uniref:anti-sigma factor n=1 Tax=Rasiella sp. SM2506 TaxID=3423914 RepID=UPI003D78CBCB